LSAPRSPQGSPVICQAGGSARGRQFAAQWSETIITHVQGVAAMKAFRDDVRARAVEAGRDPNKIKVLFLIGPMLGETRAEAEDRRRERFETAEREVEFGLAALSRSSGIDFSQYDLDEPLPALKSNGHQSSTAMLEGKVLREVLRTQRNLECVPLTGTPADVAAEIDELMQEVGGDGFLICNSYFTRRYVTEVCDGLVPELQKRGLTRKHYEYEHFRDNLLAF
jgi:alkanesulfonate monooxygenase SsuD/methylene tetrahydromethanopterin reductase-like flavin-dependent oxidoreductase (luciferase family)